MSGTFDRTSFKTFKDLKLKKIEIYDVLMPYTEDAGLPYLIVQSSLQTDIGSTVKHWSV